MVDWARKKSLAARVGILGLPWVLSAAAYVPQRAVALDHIARSAPAVVQADEPEFVIQWVLRPQHLGSCVTATPNLRRAVFEGGSRVRIEAIGIDADTAVVRSYMRNERLFRVSLKRVSEGEYQRNLAALFRQERHGDGPMLRLVPTQRGLASFASLEFPRTFPANSQGSAELVAHLRVLLGSRSGPGRSRIVNAEGGQR